MRTLIALCLASGVVTSCMLPPVPPTGLPPHVGTGKTAPVPGIVAPQNPCQALNAEPLPPPATHDPLSTPVNHAATPPKDPEPEWNTEREQLRRFIATMEAVTDKLKANEANELWGTPTMLERQGDFVRVTWPALPPNSPQPGLSLRPAGNALSCVFDALGILRHWMLTPAQFSPAQTPPPALAP